MPFVTLRKSVMSDWLPLTPTSTTTPWALGSADLNSLLVLDYLTPNITMGTLD